MNVTVRFANPFMLILFIVALLMIGWAIGSEWGHTLTAGWMLFLATILLLVHDMAMAALLAIAAVKVASSGKKQVQGLARTTAESPESIRMELRTTSTSPRISSRAVGHRNYRRVSPHLDLAIEELVFSVRTYGRLKDAGIHSVRALVQFTRKDLIHAGLTSRMIDEIRKTLGAVGLQLGMHCEDQQKDQDRDS